MPLNDVKTQSPATDQKSIKKKNLPSAAILSISGAIEEIRKFTDDKIASQLANIILYKLKQLKKINIFLSLIDKLSKDEKKEFEEQKEQIAIFLTKKLNGSIIDPNLASIKVKNSFLGDVFHDASLAVAKACPRNFKDPITQQETDEIPENNVVYTSDRSRLHLEALIGYINSVGEFKHPEFRTKFTKRDIETIKKFAKLHQPELKIEFLEDQKCKLSKSDLTTLDLDAIEAHLNAMEQLLHQRFFAVNRADRDNFQDEKQYFIVMQRIHNAKLLNRDNVNTINQLLDFDRNTRKENLEQLLSATCNFMGTPSFNQINLDCIFENIRRKGSTHLSQTLMHLDNSGINTSENREALLQIASSSLSRPSPAIVTLVASIFIRLHRANLLSHNRNYFVANIQNFTYGQIENLNFMATELLRAQIFTQENLETIIQLAKNKIISDAIVIIGNAYLLNDIILNALIELSPDHSFINALDRLEKSGLLNQKNLIDLMIHPGDTENFLATLLQNRQQPKI